MTIKDILDDFSKKEELHRQKMLEDEAKTRLEIERRIQDINQCFETVILPAVYSVENDLQLAGYWYKVTIGQFTAAEFDSPISDISQSVVDAFLEKFIKGAIGVYQSDRILL